MSRQGSHRDIHHHNAPLLATEHSAHSAEAQHGPQTRLRPRPSADAAGLRRPPHTPPSARRSRRSAQAEQAAQPSSERWLVLRSEASERLVASERVEGGRAASKRPPLAEAAHRLTGIGTASGGSLYARMTPLGAESRRAKRKAQTKSVFVSKTKSLFVSSRFSAENEKPFRFARAKRKQNERQTKGKRKANERQTKGKRKQNESCGRPKHI